MIYVLTGQGKGKTTSALGMGIRAIGARQKVLMIQFLKTNTAFENKTIKKIKNFQIQAFGRPGFYLPRAVLKKNPKLQKKGVKPFTGKDFLLVKKGISSFEKAIKVKKYDLIILDEINMVFAFKLFPVKKFLLIVKKMPKNLDLVLTGRKAPKELIKIADLVTNFKEVKHPYQKGIMAVKGREY